MPAKYKCTPINVQCFSPGENGPKILMANNACLIGGDVAGFPTLFFRVPQET